MTRPNLNNPMVGGIGDSAVARRLRPPNHRTYPARGGLDLVTPKVMRNRNPGMAITCHNWDPVEGGYRRSPGVRLFDGAERPQGGFNRSNFYSWSVGRDPVPITAGTDEHPTDLGGLWRYKGDTYAWSMPDGYDGSPSGGRIRMYKSGDAGWTTVNNYRFVNFENGAGNPPVVGADVTISAAAETKLTYKLTGIGVRSGDYSSGDARGYLVLAWPVVSSEVGSGFTVGQIEWFGQEAGDQLSAYVDSGSVSIREGGPHTRFGDFVDDGVHPVSAVNANFRGEAGAERMYFTTDDGAYEFDGENLVPIEIVPNMAARPYTNLGSLFKGGIVGIAEYRNHLFVALGNGSIMHSAPGEPTNFRAVDGAGEIAAGETVTGIVSGWLDSLIVTTVNKTLRLTGSSSVDWQLTTLSENAGAMPRTAQLAESPIMFDDRGIRMVRATDAFGDMHIDYISNIIQPLIDEKRRAGAFPTASAMVRSRSQYQVFLSDCTHLVATFLNSPVDNSPTVAFSTGSFHSVGIFDGTQDTCVIAACSVEDDDGRERTFVAKKGSRYVLETMIDEFFAYRQPAGLQLSYNDFGSPTMDKVWRKMAVEVDYGHINDSLEESMSLQISAWLDDGDRAVQPAAIHETTGTKSLFEHRIAGAGRNISPLIQAVSIGSVPVTITGITVDFTPGRRRN